MFLNNKYFISLWVHFLSKPHYLHKILQHPACTYKLDKQKLDFNFVVFYNSNIKIKANIQNQIK